MASAQSIIPLISAAAQQYGVPAWLALGVGRAESGLDPDVHDSSAGAIGPMQLMPATAKALGVDPRDAAQNIDGGVRYLGQLYKQFGGDARLTAAAYNAGPGAVQQHGGVPPYKETQAYVAKVTGSPAPASPPATGGLPSQNWQAFMPQTPGAQTPSATPGAPSQAAPPSVQDLLAYTGAPKGGPAASAPPNASPNAPGESGMPSPQELARYTGAPNLVAAPAPKAGVMPSAQAYTPGQQAAESALTHGLGVDEYAKRLAMSDVTGPSVYGMVPSQAFHGVTQGFDTDILGALQQGATGISNLAQKLTGGKPNFSAADAARVAMDLNRAKLKYEQSAAPVQSFVSQAVSGALPFVAGGEALGLGKFAAAVPEAAGALGRVGQVAMRAVRAMPVAGALGAAQGAVQAVGNAPAATPFGQMGQRIAQQAPGGAVTGGALGALTGGAMEVAGPAINAVRPLVGRLGTAAREAMAPAAESAAEAVPTAAETEAARLKVAELIRKAGGPDRVLTATQRVNGEPTPLPAETSTVEALGPAAAQVMKREAVRLGPLGDRETAELAQSRSADVGHRISEGFATSAGVTPETAAGDISALVQQGRAEAEPLREKIDWTAPVWNQDLQALAQRPAVRAAMRDASATVANEGRSPAQIGLPPPEGPGGNYTPEQARAMQAEFAQTGKVGAPRPTAEAWEETKKALDSAAMWGTDLRGLEATKSSREISAIQGSRTAAKALRTALAGDADAGTEGAIPGYGEYLQKAAAPLKVRSAYQEGRDAAFNPRISAEHLADRFKMLSEPEQKAFLGGAANSLYDRIDNGQVTLKSLMTERVQKKLATMMGEGPASAFMTRLRQEVLLERGVPVLKSAARGAPPGQTEEDALHAEEVGKVARTISRVMKPTQWPELLTESYGHVQSAGVSPGERAAMLRLLRQPARQTIEEVRPHVTEAQKAHALRIERLQRGARLRQMAAPVAVGALGAALPQ